MIAFRIKKKSIGIGSGRPPGITIEECTSWYRQLNAMFITCAPCGKAKGVPFSSTVPNSN